MAEKAPIDLYNEGLGDGAVYAVAVMGNASRKTLAKLLKEIQVKKRELRKESSNDNR